MRIRKTELRPLLWRCVMLGTALMGVLAAVAMAQEKARATPEEARPAAAKSEGFRSPERLDEYILAGGPLMIPICLSSLVAMFVTLERLVVLRKRRVIPRDFVMRFIQQLEQGKLDRRGALTLCEDNGSPVAHVFEHGVRKWGRPSVEVEQAIIDGGERQVSHLRKRLRALNAVATMGPLLGLLGTVIGMIQTFYKIASSAGAAKASDFAGGIGIAMITTAGGLLVAIPSMLFYFYFMGKVDGLVLDMDEAAQKVVNLISAEALASPPTPSAARPAPKLRTDEDMEQSREIKERRKVVS